MATTPQQTIRYGARQIAEQTDLEDHVAENPIVTEAMMTTYETDPELIAQVLPKPLEPGEEPLVMVSVQKVNMNGREFGSAVIAVTCSYNGKQGSYPLLMPQSIEQSLVGGRETFGEPKKLGEISLTREGNGGVGDTVHGTIKRLGFDLVDIKGTVGEAREVPSEPMVSLEWYFKFFKSPEGRGITHPHLVECTYERKPIKIENVDATLTIGESPVDPICDLPVRKIRETTFIERRTKQTAIIAQDVPAEWIEPFAHQRYDDFAAFNKK